MNKIKGVLIGCGFFAENQMYAWQDLGIDIVGVYDTSFDKAKHFEKKFDTRAYHDIDTMLKECYPLFVDIVTPSNTHLDIIKQIVKYDVNIICQKPFAEDMDEILQMIDMTKDTSLVIHENFRYQKPFVVAKEMIEQGDIGELFYAHLSFRSGFDVYKAQPYLATIDRFTLMDIGSHLFDLARYLCGEVEELNCLTQRVNKKIKAEDTFYASLKHKNGIISNVDCSYYTTIDPDPFPLTIATFEGSKGSIKIDTSYTLTLTTKENQVTQNIRPETPRWGDKDFSLVQDSVISFQRNYIEALTSNTTPATYAIDNKKTMELVFAAYKSAEEQRRIKL